MPKKSLTIIKSEKKKDFNLYEDIKHNPLYTKSTTNRDDIAREFLKDNTQNIAHSKIVPGQLLLFYYFEPKTKAELEYYDASPCTIFFGYYNSKQGKRVIGFNIHYYPPRTRWIIMTEIFKVFKPVMMKYFEDGIIKEIDAFDYKYIMEELERKKLAFGVRQYDPPLMTNIHNIAPNCWATACYTEGWFKKLTRDAVMKYWKQKHYK
jgi:hypothetical protein